MAKRSSGPVRLNIYLPDRAMRTRVKTAAAERDLSISEYCVRAIAAELEREVPVKAGPSAALENAVRRARRFQGTVLGKKLFRIQSADLIESARRERNAAGGNRRR